MKEMFLLSEHRLSSATATTGSVTMTTNTQPFQRRLRIFIPLKHVERPVESQKMLPPLQIQTLA